MSGQKNGGLRALPPEIKDPALKLRLKELKEWLGSQTGKRWLIKVAALGFLSVLLAAMATPLPWGWTEVARVAGLIVLVCLFLRVFHGSWFRLLTMRLGGEISRKEVIFISVLVVLTTVMAKGFYLFSEAFLHGWPAIGAGALAFGAPLCAGPLLAAILLGPQAGMVFAVFSGFFASLMWPGSDGLFIYFVLTGVVAAHKVKGGRTRADLLQAGAWSSLAGVLTVAGIALSQGWLFSANFLMAWPAAALAGLLGGVLTAGLAPMFEMVFGFTTDIKLMELSSLDNQILRELMLKAPGTHHHSLVVGSLVEAAAREIGANHLLAKAAALYHDIGKTKKPDYFVENQLGGSNRHEKLAPSMSALILISHVKEGVELARKHRLGKPVIDIMSQHHGTRLINYFYQKALDCRRQAGRNEPDPEGFRYPGPRPQTREAGLVMLADAVEAATRALENRTAARIQGVVQTQINNIFAEGQLDECELTLKDLHKIAKTFNAILNGIFHQRLEYPQSPEKTKRRHGDTDTKPSGTAEVEHEGPRETDPADLKRLGMR